MRILVQESPNLELCFVVEKIWSFEVSVAIL
jgi:hypothetical protein